MVITRWRFTLLNLIKYFALEARIPQAGPIKKLHQEILYLGVLAGIFGKALNEYFLNGSQISVGQLASGVIISLVIFPVVYRHGGFDRRRLNLVTWCIAFQNGFFWPIMLERVTNAFVR